MWSRAIFFFSFSHTHVYMDARRFRRAQFASASSSDRIGSDRSFDCFVDRE
jgi:hypothetical protein